MKEVLPSMTRRNFLKFSTMALGGVSLSMYGVKMKSEPDYSDPSYQYWRNKSPGAMASEKYLALCGSLAPSPHNTQPWKFALEKGRISVYADKARNLGAGDAKQRMMLLGIGCALENMGIAARELGYRPEIKTVANTHFNGSGLCARVSLVKNRAAGREALFPSIFERRTTRAPFEPEPVSSNFRRAVEADNDLSGARVDWFESAEDRGAVADENKRAVRSYVSDEPAYRGGLAWWRYTRRELLSKRDGISIFGSGAPFFVKQGFEWGVSPEMMAGNFGRDGEVSMSDGLSDAAPLWGLISSESDDFNARIRAGRLAERAYLQAARLGYSLSPLAYVTESEESAARLKNRFRIPERRVLMFLFRVGKAAPLERSVRRSLQDIVIG